MNELKFWELPEWVKMKTDSLKTEKILDRVEYLKLVGAENYSHAKYDEYLQTMEKYFERPLEERERENHYFKYGVS